MQLSRILFEATAGLSQMEMKLAMLLYPDDILFYDADDAREYYELSHTTQEIKIDRIAEACGITGQPSRYTLLHETVKRLKSRTIPSGVDADDENDIEGKLFDWIDFQNGKLRYRLNSPLFHAVCGDLKRTYIPDELLRSLSTTGYSLRLYLLLRVTTDKNIPLDFLAYDLFRGKNSYHPAYTPCAYANQKTVLDRAVQEINAVSDISVTMTGIKTKRSYDAWQCSILRDDGTHSYWIEDGTDNKIHDTIKNIFNISISNTAAYAIARCYTDETEYKTAMHTIAPDIALLRTAGLLDNDRHITEYIIQKSITFPHQQPVFWYQQHKAQVLIDAIIHQEGVSPVCAARLFDIDGGYMELVQDIKIPFKINNMLLS